jgi:hypothetical protein
MSAPLLAQRHLSVITRHADSELARIQDAIAHAVRVDDRSDVERMFGELLAIEHPVVPKTLDLIGHSTADSSLLKLGDWVIDAANAAVTAFFHELADLDVLPRLGVYAVRLLGCQTAETEHGRATMCALSDIIELEVYGTTDLIFASHYDRHGFKDDRDFVLTSSTDVRRKTRPPQELLRGSPYPRALDVDALPATSLQATDRAWPQRIASGDAAASILRLIRRGDGATMPGLLTVPRCEIALPAARAGAYHVAQILGDYEFIRVYPDGPDGDGIVYPVTDPHALRAIVDNLPSC